MTVTAPKIDARTAAEITTELRELLQMYAPAWKEFDPASGRPTGASAALIGIFARYAEIVIERLNQVPDKNFLAFLDLLGAARLPPQPARVPLTFTLAAGSTADAEVLQGTQVAAPPPPGAKNPVVFETERPLVATAAQLTSLLTLDPQQDSYGDWSERLAAPAAFPVFRGDRALEHVVYLGDSQLLGYAEIKNLRVRVTLITPAAAIDPDPRVVRWEQWDGTQWRLLKPSADPTDGLTKSGTIHFGAISAVPEGTVDGRTNRWLRCRLLTPVTLTSVRQEGMVRASQLPKIKRIITAVHLERTVSEGVVPDLGFIGGAPLDLSKAFFPFGEKPKLHDTLFLASAEVLSKDRTASVSYSSARVELDVILANSHLVPGPGSVRPSVDLELAWECWSGSHWQKVGAGAAPTWLSLLELDPVPALQTIDGVTSVIMQGTAQLGALLTCDALPLQTGVAPTYLVVGADGRFADKRTATTGVNVFEFEAALRGRRVKAWVTVFNGIPTVELMSVLPSLPVASATFALVVAVSGREAPLVARLRVTNGSTGEVVERPPNVPLPMALEEGRNELLIQAFDAHDIRKAAAAVTVSRRAAAPLVDADGFSDGTFGLSQSGVVTLRLPDTMAKTTVSGQENFWLRVRLAKGDYGKDASYVLKDPVKPADGFTLVQASFRPPIVSALKLGYELTPRRSPEVCVAYNELAYVDCTAAAGGAPPAFAPFAVATEAKRPGLYLGFTLPAVRRTFRNSTISLYHSAAVARYGERTVPLSPETASASGAAGTNVTHRFTITNPAVQREDFVIRLLGYRWPAIATVPIDAGASHELTVPIDAGGSRELTVQVSIPANAKAGDSDRGFVRIAAGSEPDRIYSAQFTTGVVLLASAAPVAVAWQYWDGTDWTKLTVQDDSGNFTRSGLTEFLAPHDFARRTLFGRERYWLRAERDQGEYKKFQPRLNRILLNTTLAAQTTTVVREVLGSGTGAAGQQFRSTRTPVLAGQVLEVRELGKPSDKELASLKQEEGEDVVTVVADATERPREIWVRWHEVTAFYGSGPHDRHYVINHLSGEIRFGDGVNGRVPPPGTGNLRLARYQTGGGNVGNSAAGSVTQLKTTVPYVEKASNPEAAAGGAEPETTDALLARLPRTLRHRDRAVTFEDYEDLAQLASTEVARAHCVPLYDLEADALGRVAQPGAVSVIVVPRTGDVKPLPQLELLARVQESLKARSPMTARLAVVGPMYIRVDVTAEIAVSGLTGASAVERAVHARLAAFLHPLTGGLDGNGWDFGRAPHRSDFFALIESVPGVNYVRYLQITEVEDQPGVRRTGRFLVFSGQHQISLMFE